MSQHPAAPRSYLKRHALAVQSLTLAAMLALPYLLYLAVSAGAGGAAIVLLVLLAAVMAFATMTN